MGEYRPPARRKQTEPWSAERIARLRARLGLTQVSFADELGVRQQTVSEWETGRYEPRGASAKLLGMLAERAVAYDEAAGDDDAGGMQGAPGGGRSQAGERGTPC